MSMCMLCVVCAAGAVKPGTSAGTRYGGFSTMAAPLADTLPGGEKDLAARVRESCEWLAA